MKIKLESPANLRKIRAKLMEDQVHWCNKIVKLNTRYSNRIRIINSKIEQIDKLLKD